jgi:LPXTG-motif cell wall-anchored protein
VEPVIDNNPLAEANSPFQNTILILVGLCVLVLIFGIVILVRAKKT